VEWAARLLIVVDQFEELITQTRPRRRAESAEVLRDTLTSPVQVGQTARSNRSAVSISTTMGYELET
jgi:hypothetical protein